MPISAAPYHLRPANSDDLEFALELNRISMQPYLPGLPGWTDQFGRDEMRRRWVADPYQIIVVDGRRAGMLVVTDRNGLRVLKHIELMPQFQGQGIGAAVIGDVIAGAIGAGLGVTLYVLTSNPARRLYERLGFAITETVDTGSHGVKYRMDLKTESS